MAFLVVLGQPRLFRRLILFSQMSHIHFPLTNASRCRLSIIYLDILSLREESFSVTYGTLNLKRIFFIYVMVIDRALNGLSFSDLKS